MGRKTQSTHTAEKLNAAVAEAARLLSLDLARCSAVMRATLEEAGKPVVWDRSEVISRAVKLAHASAKLAACIGQLNGTRQTINVERSAPRTEIAPQSAPNNTARNDAKAALSLEKSLPKPTKPGEGG